jgi:protein-S-isoprenylcysteine O-methyltransferase Ste14
VPARLLAAAGVPLSPTAGPLAVAGIGLAAAGALLALACLFAFSFAGRGTPAPFDPPRRLVVTGPYRYSRNPMYLGAALALAGAALFHRAPSLAVYAVLFLGAAHLFVLTYEEPTLARRFGPEYDAYRARVNRWLPRL